MGAGQSGAVELGGSSMGYQVLRVYPNSPGSRAGLKAYFDFIIAIGNTRFSKENGSLREILKASVDQKLKMTVLNTRTKRTREVEIVPSTSWGGNGLLGVSIKHSSFDRADERVWHVVQVEPGSPAYQAGFKANEDYVIGSDSILQENDDLYNLVEAHEGKALKLFLYNVNTDNCREVVCHPNSKWGGKGYLGCEFGHGLLHRIPYVGGEDDNQSDNVRASLIRNEYPVATQELHNSSYNNNTMTFQNQLMKQQLQQLQKPTQPGQQLFQQALFNNQQQFPPSQQLTQHSAPTLQPPQLQMSQLSLGPEPQEQQQQALLPLSQYQAQYQLHQQQQQPPPAPPPPTQQQSQQQQAHEQQPQSYYQQQPAAPYQQPTQQSYMQQESQVQPEMPQLSYPGQHLSFAQPKPSQEAQQQSYQQPPEQSNYPPPPPMAPPQQQQHQMQQPSSYLLNQQPQQHQQHYQAQVPPPPPPPQLQHPQYQSAQQQQHQGYQQQPPPPPPQLSPPQAQQQQQQPPPPPPPQVPQTFAQLAAASQFQQIRPPQFSPPLDGKTGATGGGTVAGSGEGGESSNSNLLS